MAQAYKDYIFVEDEKDFIYAVSLSAIVKVHWGPGERDWFVIQRSTIIDSGGRNRYPTPCPTVGKVLSGEALLELLPDGFFTAPVRFEVLDSPNIEHTLPLLRSERIPSGVDWTKTMFDIYSAQKTLASRIPINIKGQCCGGIDFYYTFYDKFGNIKIQNGSVSFEEVCRNRTYPPYAALLAEIIRVWHLL